jgi:hypothetical protein
MQIFAAVALAGFSLGCPMPQTNYDWCAATTNGGVPTGGFMTRQGSVLGGMPGTPVYVQQPTPAMPGNQTVPANPTPSTPSGIPTPAAPLDSPMSAADAGTRPVSATMPARNTAPARNAIPASESSDAESGN